MKHKPHKPVTVSAVNSMQLVMTGWRDYFTEHEVQLNLTLALNYCVNFQNLKIKGYLITGHKLFLILYCWELEIDDLLHAFAEQLRRQLKQELKMRRRHEESMDDEDLEEVLHRVFKRQDFTNQHLKELLIGRNAALPYYSQPLERLKTYVRHHHYCSAIDYAGGIGPVRIYMSN